MAPGKAIGVETPSIEGPTVLLDEPKRLVPVADAVTAVVPETETTSRRPSPIPSVAAEGLPVNRKGRPLTPVVGQAIKGALHAPTDAAAEVPAATNRVGPARPPTLEVHPTPKVDVGVPRNEATVRLARLGPTPVVPACARPFRPAKAVVTGVEGTKAIIRPVGPARHGATFAATGGPDVEEPKGSAIGAPILRAMEALISGPVGQPAAVATDVGTEVGPSAGRPEVEATNGLDIPSAVGRATVAAVPHAVTEKGTDPSVPVVGRTALPTIMTQEARVGGEVGLTIPAIG